MIQNALLHFSSRRKILHHPWTCQGTIDGIHLGNRLHWNSVIPWRHKVLKGDLMRSLRYSAFEKFEHDLKMIWYDLRTPHLTTKKEMAVFLARRCTYTYWHILRHTDTCWHILTGGVGFYPEGGTIHEMHVNNVLPKIARCHTKLATACKKCVLPAASQALVPSNPHKFFLSFYFILIVPKSSGWHIRVEIESRIVLFPSRFPLWK